MQALQQMYIDKLGADRRSHGSIGAQPPARGQKKATSTSSAERMQSDSILAAMQGRRRQANAGSLTANENGKSSLQLSRSERKRLLNQQNNGRRHNRSQKRGLHAGTTGRSGGDNGRTNSNHFLVETVPDARQKQVKTKRNEKRERAREAHILANPQVGGLVGEGAHLEQPEEEQVPHQRSQSLVNITNLIKGTEHASEQVLIHQRDESADSKAQFLTSFIQENPVDSSVNARQNAVNESGWFSKSTLQAKNSQSSMERYELNSGAMEPAIVASSAVNMGKQSQSTRRQAAARARKNNQNMAYAVEAKRVSMTGSNVPLHNVKTNRNPSNPSLAMASWSRLQQADAHTLAGKQIGHRSRNAPAFKTNSVHSIRIKKAPGISGELYGFSTMQDLANQVAAAEPTDLQGRLT